MEPPPRLQDGREEDGRHEDIKLALGRTVGKKANYSYGVLFPEFHLKKIYQLSIGREINFL
jgi:hypothetical protein